MSETLGAADIFRVNGGVRRQLLLVGFDDQQAQGISWAMDKAQWECERIKDRDKAQNTIEAFRFDLIVIYFNEFNPKLLRYISEIRRSGQTNETTHVFVAGPKQTEEAQKQLISAGASDIIKLSTPTKRIRT